MGSWLKLNIIKMGDSMKKYIIITGLLICFCAIVISYVVGKGYNTQKVSNNESYNTMEQPSYKIKPIKECGITIFKAGVYTNEEGKELFEVYMDFSNPSNEAKSFSNTVGLTAYQDGIELERAATHENNSLKIRDGAAISVGSMFILRSDSDVTLDFTEAYRKGVIDSISYSIE